MTEKNRSATRFPHVIRVFDDEIAESKVLDYVYTNIKISVLRTISIDYIKHFYVDVYHNYIDTIYCILFYNMLCMSLFSGF